MTNNYISEIRNIAVHEIVKCSLANGPGRRLVIWVQGCNFAVKCKGCFNESTHDLLGGNLMHVDQIVNLIAQAIRMYDIEGVTISGGEPLHQAVPVAFLTQAIKEKFRELSIVLLTGYSAPQLDKLRGNAQPAFISQAINLVYKSVDVIIAGRYDETKSVANHYIGSSNKALLLLSDRYTEVDFQSVPTTEVQVDKSGAVTITGIHPGQFQELLDILT